MFKETPLKLPQNGLQRGKMVLTDKENYLTRQEAFANNDCLFVNVVFFFSGGLTGLFMELGPYQIQDDLSLISNPYSWNKHYRLMFFDSPVGTGFSITQNFRKNLSQVALDQIAGIFYFF